MFVELHIIQNFAPSCLNRDDTNSPKDTVFGGYRRARISSQCIKRSIRQHPEFRSRLQDSLGTRSKRLVEELAAVVEKKGKDKQEAEDIVRYVLEASKFKMDGEKSSVLLFLGQDEVGRVADDIISNWEPLKSAALSAGQKEARKGDSEKKGEKKGKKKKSNIPAEVQEALARLADGTKAADIALFGRMVAEETSMNIDGAIQVAHAISTNEVTMEMDFYTAVDDLNPAEETGAGMMGIVEFNSSCFYRYTLVDFDSLVKNLQGDHQLAERTLEALLRAAVLAIPTGKQNSMAAQNPPLYIRVIVRNAGAPWSLANAFVSPVRPGRKDGDDLPRGSVKALEEHFSSLEKMYGNQGIEVDARSSVYGEEGHVPVEELFEKVLTSVRKAK
jgi:CRISPR system Cascade subunit CasC